MDGDETVNKERLKMKTKNNRQCVSGRNYMSALLALLLCALVYTTAVAKEVSFQMEESASPPKGVRQIEAEAKKEERKKALETKDAAAASATTTTAGGTRRMEENLKKDKVNYHGIFDALTPFAPLFTLKSGNIKASFLNLANNTGNSSTYGFRRNFSGGYFLETNEQNIGKLEKVSVKTQYNRQLRNSLSVNSMSEFGGSVFGTNLKYNRTVGRTGGAAGAGGSQNVSDARRFSAEYKRKNGLALSYNVNQNIARAISAAPTRTNNKTQTWLFSTPLKFREGAKLTLTRSDTANWDVAGGAFAKSQLANARLDVPLNEQFDLNLGFQFLGNKNKPAAAMASENRKNTRSLGLTYKFSDDTKLSYLYNFSSNRNFSTLVTSFDTINKDTQLERALSNDAKLKLGYTTTYDQSAGKTSARSGSFAYDHKDFNLLPGATSIDTRKQFTNSAGNSNSNYTLSVTTPLSYMEGKLTANLQNVLSVQNALATSQRTRSMNQTFSTDYKITSRFSVGESLNRLKSGTSTPSVVSARSVNNIRTDKAVYDFGKRLNFVKSMEGVKYNFTITRNNMRTEIPASSLSLNRVKNHSMLFSFKGSAWTGNYTFGRSLSLSASGPSQRALQHAIGLAFEDLQGFQVSANINGTFQSSASQMSSILKMTKKISDKTSYFLSWETLKNKSRVAGSVNTRNRFLDMGMDLTF